MKVTTLIMLIALTTLALNRKNQNLTEDRSQMLLNRPTTMVTQGISTTRSSFLYALSGAKAPGGIVAVLSCDPPQRFALSPSNSSLQGALDAVVIADPQYRWQVDEGIVNLLPSGSAPALLNLRIANFNVEAVTVDEALGQLLATPEMRKGVGELNASSQIFRGGLGYFDPAKPNKDRSVQKISLTLENITVREVLNAIARAHGSAVWSYTELHCGTKRFELKFLPQ
ncbi:MAG: hypothetical protein MSG64_16010 [Pyrinomonadaceae bacterium MAG19_C2-C3]|nr:hypothetical protein [Pyrinomonadaceae bacterium MAG19_C2-C3]